MTFCAGLICITELCALEHWLVHIIVSVTVSPNLLSWSPHFYLCVHIYYKGSTQKPGSQCIIPLFSYCIAMWYAMFQSLVKLMEIRTCWGRG